MKQPTQNWVLQKFNKLQKRLLRSITQGTFLKLATDKQLQLTRRVYNYASTVKRSIKPAIVSAFVAVGFATTANGQIVFTEQTGLANPLDTVTATLLFDPAFVDIDNDGDMDAFLGEYDGTIRYFRNIGTATSPIFQQQTGVNNPLDTVDVGAYSSPAFVDIDNDGDMDLFSGENSGSIFHFRNIGTTTAPIFQQQFATNNPFDGVDVGASSTPTFVDIDNDGDMDAFIGAGDGKIKYFKNNGTSAAPILQQQLATNNPLDTVDVIEFSAPTFVDIDNDGDEDLFIGALDGKLRFFENVGNSSSPTFQQQFTTNNPFDGVDVDDFSSPVFVNIDNDGDYDLFLGRTSISTLSTTVSFYRNDSPVSTYQLPTVAPKTLVIYPNPTKGILSFEQNLTGLATIYNSLGQSVRALQLNGQNQLSAEGLPIGNYLLRIMTEEGELQLAKFMVKE